MSYEQIRGFETRALSGSVFPAEGVVSESWKEYFRAKARNRRTLQQEVGVNTGDNETYVKDLEAAATGDPAAAARAVKINAVQARDNAERAKAGTLSRHLLSQEPDGVFINRKLGEANYWEKIAEAFDPQ